MRGKKDETFARDLLSDYLKREGYSKCTCIIANPDPPDLVITWPGGEQWGVEVARAYQQVPGFENDSNAKMRTVSSAAIGGPLRRFAEELGEKTKSDRRRDYVIYLEGPGMFSTWKISNKLTLRKWKQDTEKDILKFIRSNAQGVHRFPGGTVEAKCPGAGWRIMIGHSIAEIDSAINAVLRQVLCDKVKDLHRWNGAYAKKYLLLLNVYVLADDIKAIVDTLHRIVRDDQKCAGFDGVFWSGYPNRTIIRIDLEKKSCDGA